MDNVLEDIKKYDAQPDMDVVKKLERNLRLVMSNADSRWVSGGDVEELKRVEKWAEKNLSVDEESAHNAVAAVVEKMKGERHKNRITFYYLVIKDLGKLRQYADA